ncbi:hypothetical protein CHS0354_041330 [Potamilus streckersoni]|uniref:Uncharacterized protein n=1 Tax=Potamilus streckersoni TaxID=2493646 RepID=A0AAE0VV16_9BIVA|nr:hypothetical protein CHS0354_041330 [Potamilus streckersoni]
MAMEEIMSTKGSIIQLFNNNLYLITIHPSVSSEEKIKVMIGSSEETTFGLVVTNLVTEKPTGSMKVLVSDDSTVSIEKRGEDIFRLVEDIRRDSERMYPPYDDMPVMRINFSCGIKETPTAEALVIGNTTRIE